jgi:hypothetical protein
MAKISEKNKLIIKGKLTDLNTYINAERTNKYMAAKIKEAETQLVYYQCRKQNFKLTKTPEVAIFHWYNADHRKDYDNIEFAQKFIWDGLVLAGVIPDDSEKHTPSMRIHVHDVDPWNPRVELDLSGDMPF